MYASTARIASSTGGSAFVSEPYYREYFSDGQNYVQSGRSIYSGNSDTDHVSNPAYEGRITGQTQPSESYHHHNNNNSSSANKNVPIYAKAVTAAGLTVDLPSPDSGIGTDAITPRDQNNTIHQVRFYVSKQDTLKNRKIVDVEFVMLVELRLHSQTINF